MRRVLFLTLIVALLIPAGSVFAAPQQIADGVYILGEIWETPDEMFGAPIWEPGERVDAYLTRPSTLLADNPDTFGWPFTWGVSIWQGTGVPWETVIPWFPNLPASEQRRMSYAEDWLYASQWGGYYAEFLLPRDEVWFPCSFPLKWKCDFEIAPDVWETHSPQLVVVDPALAAEVLTLPAPYDFILGWPPFDTVSPMVIDILDAEGEVGVQFELEIVGYAWYASDIP